MATQFYMNVKLLSATHMLSDKISARIGKGCFGRERVVMKSVVRARKRTRILSL